MEWIFGAIIFIPLVIIALVIMRVDLLLHYHSTDDETESDSPPPE